MKIVPIPLDPEFLNADKYLAAIEHGLDLAAESVQGDFEETVSSWGTKPEFTIEKEPLTRTIGTNDENYARVNAGTKPHLIQPVNARALRFTVPNVPKTQPNVIDSQAGSRGDEVVFARKVNHPGITPRQFDDTIARDWAEGKLQEMVQEEINQVT